MLRKVHGRSDQLNPKSYLLVSLFPLLHSLHLYTDNSETFLGDLWMSAFLPLFHFLSFSLNVLSALFSVDLALSVSSLQIFFLLSKYLLQQPLPLLWSLPLLNRKRGLILLPISLNTSFSLWSCFWWYIGFLSVQINSILPLADMFQNKPLMSHKSKNLLR